MGVEEGGGGGKRYIYEGNEEWEAVELRGWVTGQPGQGGGESGLQYIEGGKKMNGSGTEEYSTNKVSCNRNRKVFFSGSR
jgi:hypothetical protein